MWFIFEEWLYIKATIKILISLKCYIIIDFLVAQIFCFAAIFVYVPQSATMYCPILDMQIKPFDAF